MRRVLKKAPAIALYSIVAAILISVFASACARTRPGPTIRVGSVGDDEQSLLAEITTLYLEARRYDVECCPPEDTATEARACLEDGSVDIWWQYSGDTWSVDLAHDQPIVDADELYERICTEDGARGITWLGPSPAEQSLTLVVADRLVSDFAMQTFSDLVAYQDSVDPYLRLCAPRSLVESASGVQGLERVYGLRFRRDLIVEQALDDAYASVRDGVCDCALGHATDPRVSEYGLVALTDDRAFFPASNLAIGVRTEVLATYPELEQVLTELAAEATSEELVAMQIQLKLGGTDARGLARAFLRRHGLLFER